MLKYIEIEKSGHGPRSHIGIQFFKRHAHLGELWLKIEEAC